MGLIDSSIVRALAATARIELAPGEDGALADDLARILEHLDPLRDLRTDSTPDPGEPAVSGDSLVLRPDTPGADPLLLPLSRIAPRWADGMFIVPSPPGLDGE